MANISQLEILDKLYVSPNSIVFRARRREDGRRVILKMLEEAYPSPERIAWFRREYEVTKSLADVPGVIGVHDLRSEQNRWLMEIEDFGGKALSLLLTERRLDVDEVCDIAISAARTLGAVHERGVIHKDVNPSNLIYLSATRELKIIDFGISSTLSSEDAAMRAPGEMAGTLAYIAPEQTGRMNRSVDRRADFYSLGATLYELLTGRPPFSAADPLELVHAHIARRPVPPIELDPRAGQALSDLVMKLLEKNAEDRYQSAAGLLRDITEIKRLRAEGVTAAFALGASDISGQLQIPQKLYGRDSETSALLAAFERVSGGENEVTLVSGYSGIGKSALIRQIYRPITARRGYFTSGKFDQLRRDVPYAPLVEAFRGLVLQILSESKARLATWRHDLLHVLGPNGRVLIDVIPEVEAILGPQPPVPALEPFEQQNRFRAVFQSFIQVFARAEHPLVLFVDDLQWVDSASLDLCEALMTGGGARGLFLVGAYRDNEVTEMHPLALRVAKLRQAGVAVREISLGPLSPEHLAELVADTFGRDAGVPAGLSALVHEKTGGNPFFVIEFLKHLHAEQLVTFDAREAKWRFDMDQIRSRGVTDNVVDLLAAKVQKLGERARTALTLAACIGGSFDLRTLAIVAEKAPAELAADLWESAAAGLIVAVGESYKLAGIEVEGLLESVEIVYRFAHDRVQQAAYSVLPEAERRALHHRIGKLLWSTTPAAELEQRVFDIAGQLAHAIDLITSAAERDELAALYLLAGRKAKASAAHGPALSYLQIGIGLLGAPGAADAWTRSYRLSLDLHDEAAEAACLVGQYDEMQRLVEITRARAESTLDKVPSFKVEIQRYSAQKRIQEGVKAGIAALAQLGIDIPYEPDPATIGKLAGEVAQAWAGRDIASLVDLPTMVDPTKLAVMEIMARLYIPAFNGAPGVFAMVVFYQVLLSIQYGATPRSPRGFVAYGLILCSQMFIAPGYAFGRLALRLSDRFAGAEKASAIFMFNSFIRHWQDKIQDSIEPFFEGYHIALDTGDYEYAGLCLTSAVSQSFWAGMELGPVAARAAEHSREIRRLRQEVMQELHDVHYQAVSNLLGESADPCVLTGKVMDEAEKLRLYLDSNSVTVLGCFHLNKLTLYYLFGDHERALAHAAEVEKYAGGIIALMATALYHYYEALALLAAAPSMGDIERLAALARADADLAKLTEWAKNAPDNFAHNVLLVSAERARVTGDDTAARDLYDRAIASAHQHGFLRDEALAYELCARFHAAARRDHVARLYLQEARYAYERWGATAKVRQLEERYPEQLGRAQPQARWVETSSTTTGRRSSGALDLHSVLKASQALSGEIVLDRLLARLLHTVIENAGAQRALLLLDTGGELCIEAEGEAFGAAPHLLQSTPVATCDRLPASLVLRVARTGKAEVTSDATQERLLAEDPYVQRALVRSALCMPLVHQGKTAAILYLESATVKGAFTHERLEVLNLLSAEMAIAIENARLYKKLDAANRELSAYSQTLEERVTQRTEELNDKNRQLSDTLAQLREAQEQLVLREKMASLGALTAGIAHELRNPFNFINNFATLSKDLTADLVDEMRAWTERKDAEGREAIEEIVNDLRQNAASIEQHGRRVNGILNSMLIHTASASEERRSTDLNDLVNQSAHLAHAAMRARHGGSDVHIEEAYDAALAPIVATPELGRAVINVVENACYATMQRQSAEGPGYAPTIRLTTADRGPCVELRVHDNGIGIPKNNVEKIFNPFFTTKPPGDGTGLGLSICYDIVVRKHGGDIRVDSKEGQYAEFTILLPKKAGSTSLAP